MALWNDLIPRLRNQPRVPADRLSTLQPPSTPGLTPQTSPFASPITEPSTPASMERDWDGGDGPFETALSAVGGRDRKSHDLQRDADVIDSGEAKSDGSEDDVTVSFGLALAVGCVLLLLNAVVFVGTLCQWPRLRRRRRRRRKQRHAAALAALTSYPVDDRAKPNVAGEGTEDSRVTTVVAFPL